MNIFCLNDCFPYNASKSAIIDCLSNSLREYNTLKLEFPGNVDGIITEQNPHNISLSPDFTLAECIMALEQQLKRVAFGAFNKYPVASQLIIRNEEDLINLDYVLPVNGIDYNAVNSIIAIDNEGILFTLPFHNDLKQNLLTISCSDNSNIEVHNLYGINENTLFIKDVITTSIQSKLGGFEKLLGVIGDNLYSDRFKKGFEGATKAIQDSIVEHFQHAIDRGLVSKFSTDDTLIKDVTPDKEKQVKLYELRIFKPVAFRVYFHEADHLVYLAMIEKKPAPKVQNTHIISSVDIIKELIIKEAL